MIIMGIDPSTHTGVCILNKKKEIVHTQVYDKIFPGIKGSIEISERCKDICNQCDVSHIFIESLSWGSPNKETLDMLATLNIMLRLTLIDYAPVYLLAPLSMKKFITGYGRATKKDISISLKRKWKLWNKNDNIRDAIGLALCGWHYIKNDAGPFNYSLKEKMKHVE